MTRGTYLKGNDVIVEELPEAPWYLLRTVPKKYTEQLKDGQRVKFVGRTVYGTPLATSIQPYDKETDIPPILNVKEVASLLHIHANTARRWSDQGIIKSYRITRRGDRRFRREDIQKFMDEFNHFPNAA